MIGAIYQLIGQEFAIVNASDAAVRFQGAKQCAPCAWMDAMLAPGAQKFLRGRGGLRARILTDGTLARGVATLVTGVELNLGMLLAPLAGPKLP